MLKSTHFGGCQFFWLNTLPLTERMQSFQVLFHSNYSSTALGTCLFRATRKKSWNDDFLNGHKRLKEQKKVKVLIRLQTC